MIEKLMASAEGILVIVAVVVVSVNILLTALKKILEKIMHKTETKADDKAHGIVVKVLKVSDKVLEFASANSSKLPPKVQDELKLMVDAKEPEAPKAE